MLHNGLSGMYLGFELCQIQWHRYQVSTNKPFLWNQNFRQNLTFCWFWLENMHHNGLSGMYLGLRCAKSNGTCFKSLHLSNSQKIKFSGKNFTYCWFWLGKCIKMAWVVCIRVWGGQPMAKDSSIYDKWFLRNKNFRQKFHILLIFDWEKCITMAWVACI